MTAKLKADFLQLYIYWYKVGIVIPITQVKNLKMLHLMYIDNFVKKHST